VARIRRAKEKRQQPYWAALIKGTAPANFIPRQPADLTNGVRLFENKPNGGISVTNMEGAGGSFPTRQVYRILSFRVWLMFFGCLDAAAANIDVDLYHQAVSQLYWELQVSNKQAFQAPTMYLPAGGGLYGDVGANVDQAVISNGVPSSRSICALARSIALSAGQDFYVRATVEANGLSNFGTTLGTLTDGQVVATFFLDGIHVRDIL
jgi:hypothetical protein